MRHHTKSESQNQTTRDGIGITSDRLTGRGGLALFGRDLEQIDLLTHLDRLFGRVKKNRKSIIVSPSCQTFAWILVQIKADASAHDEGIHLYFEE